MFLETDPLWLQSLFTAAVTLGAGGSLFVFALNRKLSFVEFLHRSVLAGIVLVTLACASLAGLAVAYGWMGYTGLKVYLLLPGSILLVVLFGEIRLVLQRWRYHASPPVSRINFHFEGQSLVAEPASSSSDRKFHPITTTDLALLRYEVEVAGLGLTQGAARRSLKVVQLSDFHYSPRLPFAYFRSAVELAIQEEADLVLLTGDFVTYQEDAVRLPELFEGLRGRLGLFATLGNHDYWSGAAPVLQGLKQAGVHLIANDCVRLPLWDELHLRLCGIDDPWGVPAWQPPDFQAGDLNLIISHSPDNIYRLIRYPFAGVFSGHFHAGQVRFPGFGALVVPSRYGRRFNRGHFRFKNFASSSDTHLFVSAGVGSATPLLRIYCQPEIIVVNFYIVS